MHVIPSERMLSVRLHKRGVASEGGVASMHFMPVKEAWLMYYPLQ